MEAIPSLDKSPSISRVSKLPSAYELLTLSESPELWLFSGILSIRQAQARYAYAQLLAAGGIVAFPGDVPDDPLSTPFVIATREGNTEMLIKIFRRYHARHNPPPEETAEEAGAADGGSLSSD